MNFKIGSNHRRQVVTVGEQKQQLQARIHILGRLGGLNNTEKAVLNLIAARLEFGIVMSDADVACLDSIWKRHCS